MLVLGSQEAGLSVSGQRELHSKTLFQNKTRLAKVAVTGWFLFYLESGMLIPM